jgi:hypothetical protein
MKISMLATIHYTVDSEHPDIQYIKNPLEIQSFTDVYRFDTDYLGDIDRYDMENYAKNDLRLVAGGGYNTEHIHNVTFEFSTNQNDIDKFNEELKKRFA